MPRNRDREIKGGIRERSGGYEKQRARASHTLLVF